MIVAWVLRNYAKGLVDKLPWIVSHYADDAGDAWYGQQAVYRLSLGNCVFFALLALVLYQTKYKSDWRDKHIQHGSWGLKGLLWLVFNVLPFFLPGDLVWYGWVSRFGSGIFLVVQMLILLDVTHVLNDNWFRKGEENGKYMYLLLGTTVVAYIGTAALAAVGFYLFKPSGEGSCTFNVMLLVWSLLLVAGFSILSIHPVAPHGSLFPASISSFYCMYLCFAALESEPRDYACNGVGHTEAVSGSAVFLGMMITLLAVIYSAVRAGSNTETFFTNREDNETENGTPLLKDTEEGGSAGLDGKDPDNKETTDKEDDERAIDEFEPVTYNYTFFHIVFALASMYMAMLMSGWGTDVKTALLDVSWVSVWVKMAAQFVTVLLYVWSLVAPKVCPDRDFS